MKSIKKHTGGYTVKVFKTRTAHSPDRCAACSKKKQLPFENILFLYTFVIYTLNYEKRIT